MLLLSLDQQETPNGNESPTPSTEKAKGSPSASDDDPAILYHQHLHLVMQKQVMLWQSKLRLLDWNVSLELCRLTQMPSPDCLGAISIYPERKDAIMHLLAPVDIPLLEGRFLDQEEYSYDVTIVHELLHLHFASYTEPDESPKGIAQEQTINTLSRTIVQAYKPSKILLPAVESSETGGYL